MSDRNFEDMFKQFAEQTSEQYMNLYEEFMGKYVRMPPLGIGREILIGCSFPAQNQNTNGNN